MKLPRLILCLLLVVVTAEAGKRTDWRKNRKAQSHPHNQRAIVPQLFNDLLDDPIVTDGQLSFSGGQVSNKPPQDLAPNEACELLNCDITRLGSVVTRRGTVQIGGAAGTFSIKGLAFYDTPTQQRLIASANDNMYYWTGAAWAVLDPTIPTGVGAFTGGTVRFAQGINRLYMADGLNNLWSWDGTTAADLGSAAPNQPPVGAKYIAWHTNRLCAAGMNAERDAIYFSQFLDGAVWDKAAWQIRVGAGEDDRIVGIVPWSNFNLVVLKRRSVWIVNCNPTLAVSDFEIRRISNQVGCVSGATAVQVGNDVFFLSDSGVRSVNRLLATEDQHEVGEALSGPVQDVIDRIKWDAGGWAATYWNNRYILSLTLDTTGNRYCLVYNTLVNAWSGLWDGWDAGHFSYYVPTAGAVPRLVFAKGGTNNVFEWYDYLRRDQETADVFKDNGTRIITQITTRGQDFGAPMVQKTGLSQQFTFYDSNATAVSITATTGPTFNAALLGAFSPTTNAYAATADDLLRSFGIQHLGRFGYIQYILNTNGGKLGLRSTTGTAFVETLNIEQ